MCICEQEFGQRGKQRCVRIIQIAQCHMTLKEEKTSSCLETIHKGFLEKSVVAQLWKG